MPIRSSPGAVLPRDMDARQWATYVGNQPVQSISLGDKLSWDKESNALVINGSVTADDGTIGGWTLGATALTAGSGSTSVGLDSGGTNPAIYAGSATPASAPFRVTQAGALTATSATITGAITLTNTAQTFTPTWTGFSAAPSGDLSYIDFGAYVMLYTGASLLGTSNATSMSITNLPAGIEPGDIRFVKALVVDNSTRYSAVAILGSVSSQISFNLQVVSGSLIGDSASAFTASGSKGLPAGFLIVYPK